MFPCWKAWTISCKSSQFQFDQQLQNFYSKRKSFCWGKYLLLYVITDAVFLNILLNQVCINNSFTLNISPSKALYTQVIMYSVRFLELYSTKLKIKKWRNTLIPDKDRCTYLRGTQSLFLSQGMGQLLYRVFMGARGTQCQDTDEAAQEPLSIFFFPDGNMGWSVCLREVSNYGLSCHWIILYAGWRTAKERNKKKVKRSFCILTNVNLTIGEKTNTKMHAGFLWQGPLTLLPVWASAKSCMSSGILPRSLLPRIHCYSYYAYQVFYETLFFIKSKLFYFFN